MKKVSRWVLEALFMTTAFLCGRAYGWYEAHELMKEVARRLGAVVR